MKNRYFLMYWISCLFVICFMFLWKMAHSQLLADGDVIVDSSMNKEDVIEEKPSIDLTEEEFLLATDSLLKNKSIESAYFTINKAVELYPNSSEAYFKRALIYITYLNLEKEGLEDLEMAIALDSTKGKYYQLRGHLYVQEEEIHLALKNFTKAISLKDDLKQAWKAKAICETKLKKFEDALFSVSRYIQLNPDDPMGYYIRSYNSYNADENRQVNDLQKAITLAEKGGNLERQWIFELGFVCYHNGKYARAFKAFLDYHSESSDKEIAYLYKTACLIKMLQEPDNEAYKPYYVNQDDICREVEMALNENRELLEKTGLYNTFKTANCILKSKF